MSAPQDNRNETRFEPDGRVEVIDALSGSQVGILLDISRTGLQVMTTRPVRLDSLHQWKFQLEGKAFECGVRVLWVRPGLRGGTHAVGGHFILLVPPSVETLRAWSASNRASAVGKASA